MKRMKILLAFLVLTFAVACGQKADDTFKKPIYFEQGLTTVRVTFPDGSFLESAVGSGTTVTWSTLAGKPSTFPPDAHTHSYNDITEKPGSIELVDALKSLPGGVPILILTQAQINALVIPVGESRIVVNSSIGALQYWTGTVWKIFPTTN